MKLAVVVLAGTETHEGLGRVVNALQVAKEWQEAGDEVTIVFDGAGTEALATLSDPEHRRHPLLRAVYDRVEGACAFCANAFNVNRELEAAGIRLLDEYDRHPRLCRLKQEAYDLLTF